MYGTFETNYVHTYGILSMHIYIYTIVIITNIIHIYYKFMSKYNFPG